MQRQRPSAPPPAPDRRFVPFCFTPRRPRFITSLACSIAGWANPRKPSSTCACTNNPDLLPLTRCEAPLGTERGPPRLRNGSSVVPLSVAANLDQLWYQRARDGISFPRPSRGAKHFPPEMNFVPQGDDRRALPRADHLVEQVPRAPPAADQPETNPVIRRLLQPRRRRPEKTVA